MLAYLQKLVRLTRGDFSLSPRLAVYYVTLQCKPRTRSACRMPMQRSVNNMPLYERVTSSEYRALLEKVIRLKRQAAPILGSHSYFKTLLDQTPYECYPTLVPCIRPDGWLAYPCRPMGKAGGEHTWLRKYAARIQARMPQGSNPSNHGDTESRRIKFSLCHRVTVAKRF